MGIFFLLQQNNVEVNELVNKLKDNVFRRLGGKFVKIRFVIFFKIMLKLNHKAINRFNNETIYKLKLTIL